MATDHAMPSLQIKLFLSSDSYRSAVQDGDELLCLKIKTTLIHPRPITFDIRGEFRFESVLEDTFRLQNFEWHDLTTGQILPHTGFANFCDPRSTLEPHQVLTLHPDQPLITSQVFDDGSPLCDPLFKVETDHQYKLKLRPQKTWWIEGTKDDLLSGKPVLSVDDLPAVPFITIISEDEIVFKAVP